MTAQEFIQFREKCQGEINILQHRINSARDIVTIPHKTWLRKAESKDLSIGQVLYHHPGDQTSFWQIIARVVNSQFYFAEDGAGYFIDDAWVDTRKKI